ncbi:winged helix-turn-helix domain-containing protein [Kitasatospora sp. NPDC059673]|uniref:winged helix-turn-helix domain-containing protein n=1 Tax=Kitasatospora sp. NPDC059673 TaxID=3346901 RepID=UPI0036CB915C
MAFVLLADALRAEIADAPGRTELPDRRDIAETYGCARSTVETVLRALAAEGLIEARPGGGWTVTERP